jgi:hypothetical protein
MGGLYRRPIVQGALKQNREEQILIAAAQYMRLVHPGVLFHCDTGSDAHVSKSAAGKAKAKQESRGWPDFHIPVARRGFHAFYAEVKEEGAELKMRRDGHKIRAKKVRGRIVLADYKVRLKGDWKDLHTEEQAKMAIRLRENGNWADFVIGLDELIAKIDWYLGRVDSDPTSPF